MDASEFQGLIAKLTGEIQGRPLDATLEAWLNATHGVGSQTWTALHAACEAGIAGGWMCQHEHGGLRYGRVLKPSPATHGFSVDVVDMDNVAGGHHRHPHGEIVLNLPVTPGARFNDRPAGWSVYEPGSAHTPTVTGGRAWVLYMLPEGAIEFTR